MLRDTHRPQNANAFRLDDLVSDGLQHVLRDAGDSFTELKREWRETQFVFFEPVNPLIDELLLMKVLIEDVTSEGRDPDKVSAGVRAKQDVCAAGHFVLAEVTDNQFLPTELMRLLDARRKDRMGFGCVAADDDDQASLLDVVNGAGVSAVADGT